MKNENMRGVFFVDVGYTDLVPLSCGFEACDPSHVAYGMRDYYMIHYVERGRGELRIFGKRYEIGEGNIFIIPKGADAVYTADGQNPWEYVWICFGGRMAQRLDDIAAKAPVRASDRTPFVIIRNLLRRENTGEEMATGALNLIFADVFSASARRLDYVDYAVQSINTSYMYKITVEKIARELSVDRRYLCRIFTARMGVSIKEYLTRVRMQKAKEYLATGKSVSLTAELVGYSDAFNFSKMFKKHVGTPPKKYICADVKNAPTQ